jgi:uncharacterized protein YyaL (SSP411 family)
MTVEWKRDVDAALAHAEEQDRPLLIDFSAAPAWGGCVRLEAESYADAEVSTFIHENFLPVEAHIKEHPVYFHRFDVLWTPTALILDPNGKERFRIEGYLPKSEFRAQLELGLARIGFMHKQWAAAERKYSEVVEHYPETVSAPEAVYWRGVSRYKGTNDHTALGAVAKELKEKYPGSVWTLKSSIWLE